MSATNNKKITLVFDAQTLYAGRIIFIAAIVVGLIALFLVGNQYLLASPMDAFMASLPWLIVLVVGVGGLLITWRRSQLIGVLVIGGLLAALGIWVLVSFSGAFPIGSNAAMMIQLAGFGLIGVAAIIIVGWALKKIFGEEAKVTL